MVMKKNAMRKNLRQSILKSFGRYVAIAAIIMLGAGLFMGLVMSKSDMVATGQKFINEQNMYDLRMISNYGWSEDYVEKFRALPGVEDAEGLIYLDMIAKTGDSEDLVYRFYSIPQNVNKVALRGGRMPEKDDEILADGYFWDDQVLGKQVVLSDDNNEDSLESVRYKTFTIVGYVATPLYMDMNRGTTSVGSGSLENYYYLPESAFDVDYYTEINVTLSGHHAIYTEEYNDFLSDSVDALETDAEELSEARFHDLKKEAEDAYDEGCQEYLAGLQEYRDGKKEAEEELADALQELQDAEQELKDNRQKLIDAGREIENGRDEIEVARSQLINAEAEFKSTKKSAKSQIDAARKQLDANAETVKAAYKQAQSAIKQAEDAVDQVSKVIPVEKLKSTNTKLEKQITKKQKQLKNSKDKAEKAALKAEIEGLKGQIAANNEVLAPYYQATAALQAVKKQCQPALDAKDTLDKGYAELKKQEKQLADAEAELAAAWTEFYANERSLNSAYDKLMVSWGLWHEGEEDLAEGWVEYEDAKAEVEAELSEAEAELNDAKEDLAEAREEIEDMDEPDLIILDRNSNVGFNNLDSSSNIVAGVSKVIPVFFLLVASLVCITTMTRMIDEERTQIGTLKALGYTNAEIMSKYLIYSGSGSVLGCGLGLLLGCTIFPQIIWKAYCIMLYIQPDIVLTVNWPLAVLIVVVYTVLMLTVTWYSCRKTLEEEPAELIRPKAPDPGKKIFVEKLRIWQKLSFLNKVTIRNIFRYRQRMAMMLIGISGCTALLLTGFGLRDSIVNVVDFQFENITHYDMSVFFRDELNKEDIEEFLDAVDGLAEETMLYHQSSVELDFNDRVKELYLVSGDDHLTSFIDMHENDNVIPLPENGEVVLSVGVSENMGIHTGDEIILRNADMQELKVIVSGIYDNHVYNYAIVSPETIEKQWGSSPEQQMAFVKTKQEQDVHAVSAKISELDTVMNVSISKDLADMVRGMMDALDLVILLIVFCAGLLAVIVLYNLTNININERIREIATIKVLGFNASETAAYVFKENMLLTVAGSVLGLVLGRLLLAFVMAQIKIDMVWFQTVAELKSYVLSMVLTLLASVAVNFVFYFRLDKINMAEALKSVE